MKKIILSISLMAAMFFVSCDQNSANDEVQGSTLSGQSANSKAKLALNAFRTGPDCTPVLDTAKVDRNLSGLTGDYCAWIPAPKTIGLVDVQFEGIYGSGLRPDEKDWYIGVVDPSYDCEDGWATIAPIIAVKNLNSTTIGDDPSCSPFIPENVVGAIDTAYGLDFGTVGYYDYNPSGRVITITKKIVIWKDTDSSLTWPTDYSNPTSSTVTDAYLIEITSIVPTHTSLAVYGKVSYNYTKIK